MKWWILMFIVALILLVALVIGSAASTHIFDVPTPRP